MPSLSAPIRPWLTTADGRQRTGGSHFAWEAQECIREIQRIQQNLPARDPQWHRGQPPNLPEPSITLHVSPDGQAGASGSAADPCASLEAARDAIRARKKRDERPPGGITVMIHGGRYERERAFLLEARDGGTAEKPIVYRAAPGEHPIFHGGVSVQTLHPVRDQSFRARLHEASRSQVLAADLTDAGIEDLGTPAIRGYSMPASPSREVFVAGKPMRPARWPNEGFVHVAEVLAEKRGGPVVFRYQDDRPASWKNPRDAWMFGYWYRHWADGRIPLDNRITEGTLPSETRAGRDSAMPHDMEFHDRVGFRPIPLAEIGLYASPWRDFWPITHRVSPHYHRAHD